MDLNTVEAVHAPTRRADVWPLGPADAILAGGTWLFSEPQPHLKRLVDITRLGWPPFTLHDGAQGLEISATCTLAELVELSLTLPATRPEWAAAPLFGQCCRALLAAPKIWRTATVGGNICLALPAGSMISLTAALDGTATVWRSDGTDDTMAVRDFVIGAAATILHPGDVLRSIHLPAAALRARTAFRKLAPSALGRSGIVVIGRRDSAGDGGGFTLTVTAATVRPYVFALPAVPTPTTLRSALHTIPDEAWTRDAHGDPDWRAAMTETLSEQIRIELT